MKLSDMFTYCNEAKYETAGNDVNYAFVEDGDSLYIYFQGSSSIWDWVRNFLFKKRPYKDMKVPYKVHRGFLAAWKEVEDIIIAKVTETKKQRQYNSDGTTYSYKEVYKWNRITVVGYSHGGSLAGLCHECVWFWRPDLRASGLNGYGFESPRFYGGWLVKKELKERWEHFHVIRTNNDLVTHCPPALLAFCHVGSLIKIKGDTSLVKGWYIPKCIKSHYPQVVHDALIKLEEKCYELSKSKN